MPISSGLMGHDFNNYFPYFLDGYYWYKQNGLFSLHWFTPSFCGGIPRFPNPVSIYFSVPQFLVFLVDPLTSARITFLLFSILGFSGFFILSRKIFNLAISSSILGASLFLFNDFFAHKYIVGHMTYHIFMLMPFVAYFILKPVHSSGSCRIRSYIFDITIASLLMAYMFYVDIAYVSAPTFVFILICFCLYSIKNDDFQILKTPFLKLLISGLLASGIFAAKLVAAMSFLKNHDRDYYPLPGVENVPELLTLIFKTLFWAPQHEFASKILVNMKWALGQHEFEFGITIIPLFLILLGLMLFCRDLILGLKTIHIRPYKIIAIILLCILILFPIAFNYYSPEWNAFLKQIPLFKSSSSLVRWFCLLIPVVILISVIVFDKFKIGPKFRIISVFMLIVCLVSFKIMKDRDYYQHQTYDPTEILQAYQLVKNNEWRPEITDISYYVDENNKPAITVTRNNLLAHGKSQLFCYEAIFGYGLENLPFKTLHLGPVMSEEDGILNIKNPACYVFPEENSCESGDHFSLNQKEQALAFTQYKPFNFNMSKKQFVANIISLTSLLLVLALLLENIVFHIRQQFAVKNKL